MKIRTKEKTRNTIKGFFARIWGYVVWVLIVLLTVSVVGNIRKVASIKSNVSLEQAKLEKLKEENSKLESEIAQAQSQVFIEQQVRDKLGLVKPGEAIVVLPDEDTLRKLAPRMPQDSDTLPDPTWKKWLKLFL